MRVIKESGDFVTHDEINNFWDTLKIILPVFLAYALFGAVVSMCRFFERHFHKEPFHLSKLIIGNIRDVAWTLALAAGALWLSHGNHFCCLFAVIIGSLKGYRWTSQIIDAAIYKYFGIERRRNGGVSTHAPARGATSDG